MSAKKRVSKRKVAPERYTAESYIAPTVSDGGNFEWTDEQYAMNPFTDKGYRPEITVDQVNHPEHYMFPGVEVIDLIEHLPFNRGAAIKYLARAGRKETADAVQDLEKAIWFAHREIKRLQK